MEDAVTQLTTTLLDTAFWLLSSIGDLFASYGIDPIKLLGLLCVLYMIYHFTFEVGHG